MLYILLNIIIDTNYIIAKIYLLPHPLICHHLLMLRRNPSHRTLLTRSHSTRTSRPTCSDTPRNGTRESRRSHNWSRISHSIFALLSHTHSNLGINHPWTVRMPVIHRWHGTATSLWNGYTGWHIVAAYLMSATWKVRVRSTAHYRVLTTHLCGVCNTIIYSWHIWYTWR